MLTAKKQKKINRAIESHEKKLELITVDIIFQYFAVFCVSLFADRIMGVQIAHSEGIGAMQFTICSICLFQMIRYYLLMRKING
jgi:hypothetical protein